MFTVNRVPFGGGGVPSTRAPMSSDVLAHADVGGVAVGDQISVETPARAAVRLFVPDGRSKTGCGVVV